MKFLNDNPESGLNNTLLVRLIITTLLLGSGALIYFGRGARKEAFYLAVILSSIYFLSLLYLFLQQILTRYPNYFKLSQLFFDLVFASAVITVTGGRASPFIFLYVLIIIYSSIVFSKSASYITAIVSGVLYVLIVYFQAQFNTFAPPVDGVAQTTSLWEEVGIVSAYFHLTGFLLIAVLGGYLSERISATGKELGESERSLRKLQNLHENILQSLTSGVMTIDHDGNIISVNKIGLEILGIHFEENILGRYLSSIMSGLHIEDVISQKREQMLYTMPDGKKITLGFSTSELRDADEIVQGYIIIFQDLTEVKQLEERLRTSEKMAILGQLAAGLAHELRNPLSAISGAVEILSSDVEPTEENGRLARVASQEVERLNLLVEDFLILTMPIQQLTTSVDISRILSDTVDSFSKTMRRVNINIINNVNHRIFVQGDSYRLKQAIWNLLLNSLDAMPKGGKITIDSHFEDSSAIIKFSDEGTGIDEDIISRLFDPFFTTKEVGTGLGLAIVQKVIEGYNGRINVMSSVGKGATFVITLPIIEEVFTTDVN